jgi:hypothetical protein
VYNGKLIGDGNEDFPNRMGDATLFAFSLKLSLTISFFI